VSRRCASEAVTGDRCEDAPQPERLLAAGSTATRKVTMAGSIHIAVRAATDTLGAREVRQLPLTAMRVRGWRHDAKVASASRFDRKPAGALATPPEAPWQLDRPPARLQAAVTAAALSESQNDGQYVHFKGHGGGP
jgi:hypothetical protein